MNIINVALLLFILFVLFVILITIITHIVLFLIIQIQYDEFWHFNTVRGGFAPIYHNGYQLSLFVSLHYFNLYWFIRQKKKP